MAHALVFLSTLSLRRATTWDVFLQKLNFISIHALLAESDRVKKALLLHLALFLSTLSLRRATPVGDENRRILFDFYPRSPCGERLSKQRIQAQALMISIHALLAESDGVVGCVERSCKDFYPRSPCGERLCCWNCTTETTNFYPRSPCGERRSSFSSISAI